MLSYCFRESYHPLELGGPITINESQYSLLAGLMHIGSDMHGNWVTHCKIGPNQWATGNDNYRWYAASMESVQSSFMFIYAKEDESRANLSSPFFAGRRQ